jgi:hypothetical protein
VVGFALAAAVQVLVVAVFEAVLSYRVAAWIEWVEVVVVTPLLGSGFHHAFPEEFR